MHPQCIDCLCLMHWHVLLVVFWLPIGTRTCLLAARRAYMPLSSALVRASSQHAGPICLSHQHSCVHAGLLCLSRYLYGTISVWTWRILRVGTMLSCWHNLLSSRFFLFVIKINFSSNSLLAVWGVLICGPIVYSLSPRPALQLF